MTILSTYNRFRIVIKSAQRDFKLLKRERPSKFRSTTYETEIKLKILDEYEVPADYLDDVFLTTEAGSVAITWMAKQFGKSESMLKTIQKKATKHWYAVNGKKRLNLALVGISHSFPFFKRFYCEEKKIEGHHSLTFSRVKEKGKGIYQSWSAA